MANFPTNSWKPFFTHARDMGIFDPVIHAITEEKRLGKSIFPPSEAIFRAFDLCDFERLKVVILGQDPYHGVGEANGLCFSVNEGIRNPPSLQNIFKEIKNEYTGFDTTRSSDLSDWAEQGVLLLNSVLTVEKDKPASHGSFGWQVFTDKVIVEISERKNFAVFILLGNFAQSKIPLIDSYKHAILSAPHPSPFSAHKGFFGSAVFRKCNDNLRAHGFEEIQW